MDISTVDEQDTGLNRTGLNQKIHWGSIKITSSEAQFNKVDPRRWPLKTGSNWAPAQISKHLLKFPVEPTGRSAFELLPFELLIV